MPADPIDLVHTPCLSVVDSRGVPDTLTLPAVLAHLGAEEALELPAIQAHQRQPWQAFLGQLGALALRRSGGRLDQDEDSWRADLLALAKGPESWQLVVDDLSLPAFLQPPVPEGNLGKFKRSSPSPAILDVLIAAKNHDLKLDRFSATADAEHWIYALVTLQTTEGFLGRGNYGIARMNGGFSSRPYASFARGPGWAERWQRDVELMLDLCDEITHENGFHEEDGHALLWEVPWGGGKGESLSLAQLDPFFIEVCRRVRLEHGNEGIVARVANTEGPRVDAKDRLGNLGDPFIPISAIEKGDMLPALTVSDEGFHYRRVANLLFHGGDTPFHTPALAEPRPGDRLAIFQVLVRGQGKTGGLHERQVPIPPKLAGRLGNPRKRDPIGTECHTRIQKVREVQKRLLKPALLTLAQDRLSHDMGNIDWKDDRANPWLARFDHEVDRVFFSELFQDLADEIPVEERQARWETRLYHLAKPVMQHAIQVLAPGGVHHFRAVARAKSLFEGLARSKVLPYAFEPRDETAETSPPPGATPGPPSSDSEGANP